MAKLNPVKQIVKEFAVKNHTKILAKFVDKTKDGHSIKFWAMSNDQQDLMDRLQSIFARAGYESSQKVTNLLEIRLTVKNKD